MFSTSSLGLTLCTLSALFALVPAQTWSGSGSVSGLIQELRAALADLVGEGTFNLGRVAEDQTVLFVQKAFTEGVGVIAEGLASGVNFPLQHISHLLQAAGIQVSSVSRVTPEGLIFVAQWLFVALIGYWFALLAFRLVASVLKRALKLFKVGVAIAFLGMIFSTQTTSVEGIAVRLAALVCVFILLMASALRWAVKLLKLREMFLGKMKIIRAKTKNFGSKLKIKKQKKAEK